MKESELLDGISERLRGLFPLLFETVPIGLWVMDSTGKIILSNSAGRKVWAGAQYVSPDQFGTYEGWNVDSGEKIEPHDWAAARAIEKGETTVGEKVRIRRFDGSFAYIENTALPVRDGAGAIVGGIIVNRDITDEIEARKALGESEERLRLVFDFAPVGIGLTYPDFRVMRVNRALCALLGYSEEELVGKTFIDFTHPDDIDADTELAGKLFRGEIPDYRIEKRYLRKDGSPVWGNLAASVLRDSEGKIRYAVGVIENIEMRKKAEGDLKRSEERYRLIFENIKDYAVYTVGQDGKITSWNPGAENLYGYRPEEVLEKPESMLWLPDSPQARMHQNVFEIASFEGRFEGEMLCQRKDRSRFWANTVIRAIRGPSGELTGYIAVRKDVSDLRRIENERQISFKLEREARSLAETTRARMEFLYQTTMALFEEALDEEMIMRKVTSLIVPSFGDCCTVDVTDPGGGPIRRVGLCRNPRAPQAQSAEPMNDHPPVLSDVVGAGRVLRTGEPELAPFVPEPLIRSLAKNEDHERLLKALGLASYLIVPILVEGRTIGAISVQSLNEIRRFSDEDLKFVQEIAYRFGLAITHARLVKALRRAVKDREDVVAFVSHDLKSPLSAITLSAGLISRVSAELPAQQAAAISDLTRKIKTASDNMHRLIGDLLDLSRIESGKFVLSVGPCRPSDLIRETTGIFEALAQEKGLLLEVNAADDLPLVSCDRGQLTRVLSNLLSNAVKFTRRGKVGVSAHLQGEQVRFCVSDTGPGISSESVSNLFERFWQAEPGKRQGAGLGLRIVKGIVEAHGGKVWVSSRLGRGSEFCFSVPTCTEAQMKRAS